MSGGVQQSPTAERKVRVFVSSTFSDMHAERDELAKRVFPQLRKLCEGRRIAWTDVDLRWGITDEQVRKGEVLPICLAEVGECRPFFIGLLGERYGSLPEPEDITDELVTAQPWLDEHRERSVTELEILHGVLNDPAMANRACFYFRDPAYVETVPPEKRDDFIESSPDARDKLEALKESIRKSGLALREPYANPRELAGMVLRDLTAAINQEFPPGTEPAPLDAEAAEHEAFAVSRSRVYIGRDEYFTRLDAHAAGDGPPLVIQGESGSGKSALLANWALACRAAHPDQPLVMHFIGASPYSADWAAMLRRLMGELKRTFDIDGEIPTEPDALRAEFVNWLHTAAARGRLVLILDALNQLEDTDQAPDLTWLPPVIPANIRLIVSTLPGRAADALDRRNWDAMTVEPLRPEERRRFIVDYLDSYTQSLLPAPMDRIASAPQSANPLYLQTLLDELRVVGRHETLGEQIDGYLTAADVPALYERILARYDADYTRDRPHLVRDAMTLIWAARRGLSEPELLDLLGTGETPLPRAVWAPLHYAADHSLVTRSGLIAFSHDYLRQAVASRYLPTDTARAAAHTRLADYFAPRDLTPRKVDELPWQLAEAHDWQGVYDLLANLPFFARAWRANPFEVKAYWSQVEAASQLRMTDAYRAVLDSPDRHSECVWHVAMLLSDTGHPAEALSIREQLVEHFRRVGDRSNLHKSLGNQAVIVAARGNLAEAMALLKEKEQICRELGDQAGLQVSLGNQGLILQDLGKLDAAMALFKQQEGICSELGDKVSLQASLGNQAVILHARGHLDEAMALYKQQERICRELGDRTGLSRSLGHQALVLQDRKDLAGAMTLLKEKEQICRELADRAGLQASLGNQALVLEARGEPDGAMDLLTQQERICRELGDQAGLSASLGNQANILRAGGDPDRALALLKQQERICRELGDKAVLHGSLGNQGNILYARGDLDGALALYKEKERLCRELGDQAGLSQALAHQALVLKGRGGPDGTVTMASLQEEEQICREQGDKAGVAESLGDQARILRARGVLDRALALHKEEERLCRELGDQAGLSMSLGNQALTLRALGDLDGALALHKEEERLCREQGDQAGLQCSLGNQALNLYARGDLDGAEALHQEEERICRERGDQAALAVSLGNHAYILEDRDDLVGAMAMRKEGERLCREVELFDGLVRSLTNQAVLHAGRMGRPAEAVPLAEEAYRLAIEHGLVALADKNKRILNFLQSQLG